MVVEPGLANFSNSSGSWWWSTLEAHGILQAKKNDLENYWERSEYPDPPASPAHGYRINKKPLNQSNMFKKCIFTLLKSL